MTTAAIVQQRIMGIPPSAGARDAAISGEERRERLRSGKSVAGYDFSSINSYHGLDHVTTRTAGQYPAGIGRQFGRVRGKPARYAAAAACGFPAIMSAAFSAIISTAALRCAETRSGIADASTTRSRSTP